MKPNTWITIAITSLPLITTPLISILPDFSFSPRGVIYSDHALAFFLSPLAPPRNPLELISRAAQCILLYRFPLALPLQYAFYIALATVRLILGYVLTRSVGWAYPALFSHWALYETMSGFGPMIVASMILEPTSPFYALPLVVIGFCWLEDRPWTYGLIVGMATCARMVLSQRPSLPLISEKATERATEKSPSVSVWPVVLSLCAVLPYVLTPAPRLPFPHTASLDIVVLSFPRPVDVAVSAQMLNTTILSFLPHVSNSVMLSAFTHATRHESFEQVQAHHPSITFHVDRDLHPDDETGHYLHLAEAFRYAGSREGEWIMLVEDDFPLCPGGWEVVETVISLLEREKAAGEINAGFIGTGGSGMIIHRSYLRLLSMLLRTHSQLDSILPPTVARRAPDQIVQDCILGRAGSLCERTGRAIISSRIVLDHIGGMATTTEGKALNRDKWRCGWRHPFHGEDRVNVVVV